MKIIESGFYLLVFIIMIPIAVAYGKTIEIILYIYYLSDSEIHAVRKRDKQYFKKLKKRSRLLGDMSTYKEERRFERLYKRKCAWHLTKEDIAWKRRIPD
ncbi:MAG: hypothetical protein IJV27_09705 [Prevotella sp.]|nr:hypothetical protein [Prevotella sp.]